MSKYSLELEWFRISSESMFGCAIWIMKRGEIYALWLMFQYLSLQYIVLFNTVEKNVSCNANVEIPKFFEVPTISQFEKQFGTERFARFGF